MTARLTLLAAAVATAAPASRAADWPQWRGPNRDAVAVDFAPPKAWPKELAKGWTTPVGKGVATPAVVGGRVYAFGWADGTEAVRCLDAGTGKERWKAEYPARPASGPASGFPAARSSPAVADGKVVTLGVQGVLSCLDAETGKVVWRHDDTGRVPGFATSSSPLLADGLCVVQVGGDRGAGAVAAFDLGTGADKWRWAADGTKYASPALLTVGGLKAVVVETAGSVAAVALADGKPLWQTPFSTRYNASSPVVVGSTVIFGGSGEATRAVALERKGDKLEGVEKWSNRDNPVIYNTPVVRDGLLFGLGQRGELFCIDVATGKTLWDGRLGGGPAPAPAPAAPAPGGGRPGGPGGRRGGGGGGGYGSLVAAGPVLLALTPAGEPVVLDVTRDGHKELARYRVAERGTYAYPVAVGNRVLVKDADAVTLWTIE